jgi:hypothetical protein
MQKLGIVMVQYPGKGGEYYGKEYAYYAAFPLKAGDRVTVPTREGDSKARVSRVGVREAEVASVLHMLREIPEQEPLDDAAPKAEQAEITFEGGDGA